MGAFRLGAVHVDPSRNVIEHDGGSWQLEPKVMDLLVLLAAHPGEVIGREALIDQVWKVEYGADESLTRAVSLLRKAFREAGNAGEIIETIPKRGYRLLMAPEAVATHPPDLHRNGSPPPPPHAAPATGDSAAPQKERSRPRFIRIAALAGVLLIVGVVIVGMATRWGAPTLERSIAVLPFTMEGPDEERAYLGRVVPGEIIDILSQLKGMEVIARNSSFTFEPDADILLVGRKLGVAHVLTGAVREEGADIHVSATLANAGTGRVIWTLSDTTRFTPENVPALQKEIAERVAGAMSIAFKVPASSRLTGGSTKSLEAYNSYLQGLSYWWTGGPSREAFARATSLDPDYAEAWAGQAISTASDSLAQPTLEKARQMQDAAYVMAERGVKLAPELSVTQACYGALSTTQGKWGQAEIATLKAMEISRSELPMNHRQNTLSRVGRAAESYELMLEQQANDPLSELGGFRLMGVLPATGRQSELLEIATSQGWFQSSRTINQQFGLMARVHARQPVGAIRDSLQSLSQRPDRALAEFAGGLLAVINNGDEARAYLRTAYGDPGFQHASKWEILPFLAAWLGDDELVVRVWRDSLTINTMRTIYIWGEAFAGARARPEFKQLARDLGFVDYWRTYRWADKCKPIGDTDFECG